MIKASVFMNNRTQAVRLPSSVRFPDDVKNVNIRVQGDERILSPVNYTWDSFFLAADTVDDDFLAHRGLAKQPEREAFD